jgi:hypothetical protein
MNLAHTASGFIFLLERIGFCDDVIWFDECLVCHLVSAQDPCFIFRCIESLGLFVRFDPIYNNIMNNCSTLRILDMHSNMSENMQPVRFYLTMRSRVNMLAKVIAFSASAAELYFPCEAKI